MKKNNGFLQTQFFERDGNLCIQIFLYKLQIRLCQIKLKKTIVGLRHSSSALPLNLDRKKGIG